MKQPLSNFMVRVLLGMAVCLLMTIHLLPRLQGNGSGNGYETPPTSTESVGTTSEIERLVEYGASYFLRAYQDVFRFSDMIERTDIDGTDYDEQLRVLDNALDNIRNAQKAYADLIAKAEITPYNWQVIYYLWFFDYEGFRRQYRLNPDIFNEAAYYLRNGYITEYYKLTHDRFTKIEAMLSDLRKDVDNGIMPNLKKIWEVNDLCTKTRLTGEYVARIFYELPK